MSPNEDFEMTVSDITFVALRQIVGPNQLMDWDTCRQGFLVKKVEVTMGSNQSTIVQREDTQYINLSDTINVDQLAVIIENLMNETSFQTDDGRLLKTNRVYYSGPANARQGFFLFLCQVD